jgi:GNAT superfamily N-acetyltransferase
MSIEITHEPITSDTLRSYAPIPIAFEVRSIVEINDNDWTLSERTIDIPWIKDYDDFTDERPPRWLERFDLSNWGLLVAWIDGRRVGGAVVAFDTPGVNMLEGRNDLAVLWDIRVAPEARGSGVGSALFAAVEGWARERGCRELKIETQNINVGACRFYERQGCRLGAVNRHAYPELPDEVQMLWYKDLPDVT